MDEDPAPKASIWSDVAGSGAAVAGMFICVLIFVGALLIDVSLVFVERQRAQVVADVANLAASRVSPAISGGQPSAQAIAAAQNVAQINGFSTSTVSTTVSASPNGDGTQALQTSINQSVKLAFGLFSIGKTMPTNSSSWVSASSTSDCITSLSWQTEIRDYAVVQGSSCAISANNYLYACGSANVSVASVRVGYSQSSETPLVCSNVTISPAVNKFTFSTPATDVFSSDTRISTLKSKLQGMSSGWSYGSAYPLNPSASSGGWMTYSSQTVTLTQSGSYSSITSTNSTLTFPGSGGADPTCTKPTSVSGNVIFNGTNTVNFGAGCYVFGSTMIANTGAKVTFNVGANVVFVFKGGITLNSSSQLTSGDATYYFNGGSIISNSGATLTLGNGPYYLWWCSIYVNSSTGNLKFGNGPFYLYYSSIYNNGILTFGNGPYYLQGGSITANSGSTTTFSVGDMYIYYGSINANGDLMTFGSGGSTSTGGGTVYVYGGGLTLNSKALTATGVTFGFYGGNVNLYGSGAINAAAPTASGPSYGYRDILFAVWNGSFTMSQSNAPTDTVSGLVYVASNSVSVSGNQTMNLASNGCFQLVGTTAYVYQNVNMKLAPCHDFASVASSGFGVLLK